MRHNAAVPEPSRLPMRALYVYYRVAPEQAPAARTAIETMQATLRQCQIGLRAQLMCRADGIIHSAADEATWMEIYEHPQEGVSAECEAMLQTLSHALPAGLTGPRHTEIFCDF